MFAGFSLTLNSRDEANLASKLTAKEIADAPNTEALARQTLDSFIAGNGSLDANQMLSEWFPQISCDVFISHSHKDKNMAKILAQWMNEKFGLKSFIDSSVWGYSGKLLKQLDDAYCYKEATGTYNYSKRNISTAHVHMMLTTALAMMIDKAELLLFLNTPSSINPGRSISTTDQTTYSPWIYGELSFSRLIRRRPLQEHRAGLQRRAFESAAAQDLAIQYPAPQDHLVPIYMPDLLVWEGLACDNRYESLDSLYRAHKLILESVVF